MKITIIYFSATGNTKKAAMQIEKALEERNHEIQMININRNRQIIQDNNTEEYLKNTVNKHDLLLIGAPVYSTHFQYHLLDMIPHLPVPDENWSKYAIPFVTYGGISSGNALFEAGTELEKTGRTVPLGVKINASHKLAGTFMEYEFNCNKLNEDAFFSVINELADKIDNLDFTGNVISAVKSFEYNFEKHPEGSVPDEKLLHKSKFPVIIIDKEKCIACGTCSENCPVFHLGLTDKILHEAESECIHCFKCIAECPQQAIHIGTAAEKMAAGMQVRIDQVGNCEHPESGIIY